MKRNTISVFRCAAIVMSALLLFGSCATTTVPYDGRLRAEPSGNINILMSRAAPQVSVVVDDRILVDARVWGTRRVDIENVPPGEHRVRVFANSWQLSGPIDFSDTVDVSERGNVPVVIQVSPYSTLYWIYLIGVGIVSALPTIVVVSY